MKSPPKKSVTFGDVDGDDIPKLRDSALLGWSHYDSGSDDDGSDDPPPQDQEPPLQPQAKYVEGSVGMVRGGKGVSSALRIITGRRNGVLVINLSDGGSLYFYKVFKKPLRYIKEHINQGANKTRRFTESLRKENSVFLRSQISSMSIMAESEESIFHRDKTHGRDKLDVADEVKKKIKNVAVYTSTQDFVEPAEMPYLHIPASVPWRFKTVNSLRNNSFQIVVPPCISGDETKADDRVKIMSYRDKVKNMRKLTALVNGVEVTFATVLRLGRDDDDDENDSDDGQRYPDDDSASEQGYASGWANSFKGSKTNFQVFEFCCEKDELAVYAVASQSLERMLSDNKYQNTAKAIVASNVRVRHAGRMEIAAQLRTLEKSKSVANFRDRRISSIDELEYRVFPLHAYPYTWMTKKEIAVELPRTSKNFVDLRQNKADEIGSLHVEVLQCTGLPKMDKYSLTDAFCYIVCGSSVFVTDVIPDNLNPAWLPLTRRACIFPLKNAYSQVYVGVFDDDGDKSDDDFIGRVVIDTPQLKSGFSYDITLPLRHTSKTYYRRQLGSIRLRLEMHWRAGERAALLSYIPKSPSVVTRRITNQPLEPTTTIVCPDAKSFRSVGFTVYGEDVPGKYSAHIKNATSREVTMINRLMYYQAKKTVGDIATWKNPLLTMYIFWAWMYMVVYNAIDNVPSFILSLFFIALLRNYVKYNVNSAVGSLYGHRTIGGMLGVLLFNRDDSDVQISEIQRMNNRPLLERFLLKTFELLNSSAKQKETWRTEHHSEFPFSSGSVYPKISPNEAAKSHLWDAGHCVSVSSDSVRNAVGTSTLLDWDQYDNGSSDEDEWSCDEGTGGDFRKSITKTIGLDLKKSITNAKNGIGMLPSKRVERGESGTSEGSNDASDNIEIMQRSAFSLTGERKSRRMSSLDSRSSLDSGPPIDCYSNIATLKKASKMPVIPEQDMGVKTKSLSTIISQIEKMHANASKATLHLFDDRVFVVEDRVEAEKLLRINTTNNPIAKKMNPILGAFLKIVDIELSAFRAVFNLVMWKDPFLSFLVTLFVFFLMIVLLVFPWRYLFFVVGLVGLGPQNYFLANWFEEKRFARQQMKKAATKSSFESLGSYGDLADSPLLFRNDVRVKPDGRHREIIVPSVPFRYNRFYDWPPDPASTSIKAGSYSSTDNRRK